VERRRPKPITPEKQGQTGFLCWPQKMRDLKHSKKGGMYRSRPVKRVRKEVNHFQKKVLSINPIIRRGKEKGKDREVPVEGGGWGGGVL